MQIRIFLVLILMLFLAVPGQAHDVSSLDQALLSGKSGPQFWLYAWLGAKHMVTGYDHILFLIGVIFYLNNIKSVTLFVSLFALGHTITLIGAVLFNLNVNTYIVDAVIGLSVAYKGFDNLKGFERLFGEAPDERLAVFVFGLFHGLGLGSKLQSLGLESNGLVSNLIAFNIGVEAGQFAALILILLLLRSLTPIREHKAFRRTTNIGLIIAGLIVMLHQLVQI